MERSQTLEFLEALFGYAESGNITLTEFDTKRSKHIPVQNLEEVTAVAERWSKDHDVYFGLNLRQDGLHEKARGDEKKVIAVVGFVQDIDIKGPGHKEQNLPLTLKDALLPLETCTLEPSAIVDTSGGLHSYWLLKEPFVIETESDRAKLKGISQRLPKMLLQEAKMFDWKYKLDNVTSLDHVFRLPGTLNHKPIRKGFGKKAVPVRLERLTEKRYTLTELEDYVNLLQEEAPQRNEKGVDSTDYPASSARKVLEHCRWLQHCRDDADRLTEPEWKSALQVIARCTDGDEVGHEISEPYSGYSHQETAYKLNHVRKMEPVRCITIQQDFSGYCNGCRQQVTSPIVIGQDNHDPIIGRTLPSRKTAEEEFGSLSWDAEINEKKTSGEGAPKASEAEETTSQEQNTTKQRQGEWRNYYSATDYLETSFWQDVREFSQYKGRKTGFDELDKHTTGLYPGLYVIGAISSLGKTTFIHQMADQLAERGESIMFFSLEQSQMELVAKSLSRLTARNDIKTAVSAIKIRGGNRTPQVDYAAEQYKIIGKRVSIIEGHFGMNVFEITGRVKEYVDQTGKTPVVVVDYLQIIPPYDLKMNTRDAVNDNVRQLKILQRDLNAVVVLVSAVNRANYLQPIDFESFKESGGIEYTADVVWGLQLSVINKDAIFGKEGNLREKRHKIKEAKKAVPRSLELVCLKNRYGISSYTVDLMYDPRFDYFVDTVFLDDFGPLGTQNQDDEPFGPVPSFANLTGARKKKRL